MFDFFKKNNYLIDSLQGIVDIHNHILPGIDDGSKSVDESIEMIGLFSQLGINSMVATPHIMHQFYDNDQQSIKKAYDKLIKVVATAFPYFKLKYAAEHMVDDNFENLLNNGSFLKLGKDHILIEMSYLQPSINFQEAVAKIQELGIHPILAHPERYVFLQGNLPKYKAHKENGLKFQVNLLSIAGYYGLAEQKTALNLLENSLVDFLGTDAHNPGHLNFIKEAKIKAKTADMLLPVVRNNTIFRD